MRHIAVIGAGITGVTTAYLLLHSCAELRDWLSYALWCRQESSPHITRHPPEGQLVVHVAPADHQS